MDIPCQVVILYIFFQEMKWNIIIKLSKFYYPIITPIQGALYRILTFKQFFYLTTENEQILEIRKWVPKVTTYLVYTLRVFETLCYVSDHSIIQYNAKITIFFPVPGQVKYGLKRFLYRCLFHKFNAGGGSFWIWQNIRIGLWQYTLMIC